MEPRALNLLHQCGALLLLITLNPFLLREPEAGACYAPFSTPASFSRWRPWEPQLFFFLQRQGWGSLCLSPWSAQLLTTSLRFSPQLRLGSLLTAVFWGSPLCQPSPGCLPARCRAGRGTKYHFLLVPAPGRRDRDLPGDNTQLYVNIPKQLLDISGEGRNPCTECIGDLVGTPLPSGSVD